MFAQRIVRRSPTPGSSPSSRRPAHAPAGPSRPGNQALQHAARSSLMVGKADTAHEREADQVAAGGVASPTMRPAGGGGLGPAPPSVERVVAGSGQPLAPAVREDMEQRLGRDFSQVRVHAGHAAGQSARELSADAYAVGSDIVFAPGRFDPAGERGRRLLAHELTHVAQQAGGGEARVQRSPQEGSGDDIDYQAQFWQAVHMAGVVQQAKKLTDEAVAKMVAEKGDELRAIEQNIEDIQRSGFAQQEAHKIRNLEWQRQQIFDQYDPSKRGTCDLPDPQPAPYVPRVVNLPTLALPYATRMAPVYGPMWEPNYAPDIAPDNPDRAGRRFAGQTYEHPAIRTSVQDAYTFNIETDAVQVANDLDRLGRAGYSEIHIATGTHGGPRGGLDPEFKFLREDARSIFEATQRHPGLKIIPYNMADPAQAAKFYAAQALAAEGKLPGGATIGAYCYSERSLPDRPMDPYPHVEVLRRQSVGQTLGFGGFSVASGAYGIYGGLQDPNTTMSALKVGVGATQVVGGMSYMAGHAMDSLAAVRFGSKAVSVANWATAPITLIDFYRGMQRKFEPGNVPLKGEEAVYAGVNDTLTLAGIFFPQAAIGAIVLKVAVEPAAEKASEWLTPKFIGATSEAYPGIGSQYIWGMH